MTLDRVAYSTSTWVLMVNPSISAAAVERVSGDAGLALSAAVSFTGAFVYESS